MKEEPFNLEFNKMFKWFGNESAPSLLKFELDLYKKLWNLLLIRDSKLSKEISSILKIGKQTVDTHSRNMLHKKNLNNTGELISKAIRYGWI